MRNILSVFPCWTLSLISRVGWTFWYLHKCSARVNKWVIIISHEWNKFFFDSIIIEFSVSSIVSVLAHLSRRIKWAFLIKICPCPLSSCKGYIRVLKCNENTVMNLKNLLLQNHWVKFNQTWHNASLGEGDSSLFEWRAPPFSNGR